MPTVPDAPADPFSERWPKYDRPPRENFMMAASIMLEHGMTPAQRVFDAYSAFHPADEGKAIATPSDMTMAEAISSFGPRGPGMQWLQDMATWTKHVLRSGNPSKLEGGRQDWDRRLQMERLRSIKERAQSRGIE